MVLCAAVDIHKHVFQAVVLDPTSGEVEEERFAADRDRLREWAERLVGREAVGAVEATTGWRYVSCRPARNDLGCAHEGVAGSARGAFQRPGGQHSRSWACGAITSSWPSTPTSRTGSDGQFCGTTGLARFLPSTWEWLSANAALLNKHVKQAAAVAGRSWVVPDYDLGAFMKRGYCSSDSLFRDILGAHDPYPAGFDHGGPFHPNGEGHEIEAAGTLPAVCRKLYKGDATCNAPKKTP